MWAMVVKELRQLRRDRRTLAMLVVLPVALLVVFGYAASFDVDEIPTSIVGPQAEVVAENLPDPFQVDRIDPDAGRTEARHDLRDGRNPAAVVTGDDGGVTLLLDGSELFTANTARTAMASLPDDAASQVDGEIDILFNEDLETPVVMVPALAGLILLFVGTVVTSLGVVREREAGTLEQLAVMPLRPRDVFLGKIAPYFVVATIDLAIVLAVGVALFDVPFRGSAPVLALGCLLFLFVTLGVGVVISTISQTQGQAVQMAIMALLPQVLLSGMIFPLSAMPAAIRWISYVLPLRYFTEIARGLMVRGAPLEALWQPFLFLAVLGVAAVALATLRFRRDLAPSRTGAPDAPSAGPSGDGGDHEVTLR